MRLYTVVTTVNEFKNRQNVQFNWLRWDRAGPRPYADLIRDYDPKGLAYAEGAIDELFTEAEAIALKAYLDREHGEAGITTIEEIALPISNNMAGYRANDVGGGGTDFYPLYEDEPYDLPFKASAYYDLRECEWIGVRKLIADLQNRDATSSEDPLALAIRCLRVLDVSVHDLVKFAFENRAFLVFDMSKPGVDRSKRPAWATPGQAPLPTDPVPLNEPTAGGSPSIAPR